MSAGGISKRPSLFSDDGLLILTPAGNEVRIFGCLTGECTGVLEGHCGEVTCIALNPKDQTQIYSASKDGTMKLWNYRDQICLETFQIKETVRGMAIDKELGVASLSIEWKDGMQGRVITYDISKGKAGRTALKTKASRPLVTSGPNSTFVATVDKHSLFVWRTGTEIFQPLNLTHTKPYTCVAMSADETIIAAGDATGRILIWNGFAAHVPTERREGPHAGKHQPSVPPPLTTYHWHSSAVGCLAFSADGTYLLSGGNEAVLVIWHLATGKQTFLPRLGSPVLGLCPSPGDPAKFLVRQAGNTLRIINIATMKVDTSVLGLRPRPSSLRPAQAFPATLLHPGTGFIITPCDNAQLQVYDTVLNRHVSLIQVSSRNPVAPSQRPDEWGLYGPPVEPHVSHTAFAPWDSSVMVTVDVRPDGGPYASGESCLKFWDTATCSIYSPLLTNDVLASTSGNSGAIPALALNTRVDEPHRGGVTSLSYHPTEHMVLTTGADAEFKVWTRMAMATRPGGGPSQKQWCWRCRSSGSYKGLPLSASAFSTDGSLLAVAALSRVTLWDAQSNALSCVLTPAPEQQQAILKMLAFVPNTPCLVGSSDNCLMVWNVISATLQWSLDVRTCHLAADPLYGRFAIAAPFLHPPPASKAHQQVAKQQQEPQQEQKAGAKSAAGAASKKVPITPSSDSVPSSSPAATPPAQTPAPASTVDGYRLAGPNCHVFVFDPRSPNPLYHCVAPQTVAVSLHYVGPNLPQHAQVAPSAPQGNSPLLILSEDRSYSYCRSPVHPTSMQLPQAAAPSAPTDPIAPLSAFEAAFGMLPAAGAPSAMDVDGEGGDRLADSATTKERLRQLFDAPSHALPSPANLAQAFLRLLTTAPE